MQTSSKSPTFPKSGTSVRFRLNGRPTTVETEPDRTLLRVLRTDLGLTGAKYGCGVGLCGSCTVVVDGEAVRSCQASVGSVRDADVVTIEGLAGDAGSGGTDRTALHPLQRAFIEHGAYQCGYCTPGMLMNAYALLLSGRRPTRRGILDAMEGNLCRCAAHQRIVAAIEAASREMGGGS
ncbi:MAG: (2Fe-2S)-binding protein [Acidobacteriota bacterium]|jgi:aerobic-type carbon monoxide dehydrogenase small subunit (CoxS/CutS family)